MNRRLSKELVWATVLSVITAGTFLDDAWGLVHHNPRTLTAVLPGKVQALAERVVNQVDPDAAARRRIREQADRHLTRDPDTGVVTWTTPTGLTWRGLPPPNQVTSLDPTQRWLRHELLHPPVSRGERHLARYATHHLRHQRCRC